MTDADLDELERLCREAESEDAWGKGRLSGLYWTPEAPGTEAKVWYDDGDLCATVHGNLGLGYWGNAFAALFTKAPSAIPALIARLRAAEAEVGRLRTAIGADPEPRVTA